MKLFISNLNAQRAISGKERADHFYATPSSKHHHFLREFETDAIALKVSLFLADRQTTRLNLHKKRDASTSRSFAHLNEESKLNCQNIFFWSETLLHKN